jgi:O-antigen/teichoic acid export membrane protein
MLGYSVILNSSVTFVVLCLNFGLKIYLAQQFSPENLIIYYTILDIFSIITRFFDGYKDAIITTYSKTKHKLKMLKTCWVFFMWMVLIISFIVIPLVLNFYLVQKVENLDIKWWSLSLLFMLMSFVAYYLRMLLLHRDYKMISVIDALKVVLFILSVVILYHFLKQEATYKTLIWASIYANILALLYLIYYHNRVFSRYQIVQNISLCFAKFQDDSNRAFIQKTILASANSFTYGLLLFAPVFVMLNANDIEQLSNFQVVARAIFFALIAVFSFPLGRFMFPEFASKLEKKEYASLLNIRKKFIKLLMLFGFFAIALCWLFSKQFVLLLFPMEYGNSYIMLNILIVSLPFILYQNFSESIIKSQGLYTRSLLIKGFGVMSFIGSYLVLTHLAIELASIYALMMGFFGVFVSSLGFERLEIRRWGTI